MPIYGPKNVFFSKRFIAKTPLPAFDIVDGLIVIPSGQVKSAFDCEVVEI